MKVLLATNGSQGVVALRKLLVLVMEIGKVFSLTNTDGEKQSDEGKIEDE
tara:strand:- start:219 stop:368 length:150 start_codon:yes stop_codon:yes gene_type:complete